jgi:hypothetical protein
MARVVREIANEKSEEPDFRKHPECPLGPPTMGTRLRTSMVPRHPKTSGFRNENPVEGMILQMGALISY